MANNISRRTPRAASRIAGAVLDVHHAQQRLFNHIRLDRVAGDRSRH